MPSVPRMRSTLSLVKEIIEEVSADSSIRSPDDDSVPTIGRTGFRTAGGPCMVLYDVTNSEDDHDYGFLQFSLGLATEVYDIAGAMGWANERNQFSTVGKYYCTVAHHGQHCSIIWEQLIWSGLLLGLRGPGPEWIRDQLSFSVHQAHQVAAQHAVDVQLRLQGTSFPSGPDGVTRLLLTTT